MRFLQRFVTNDGDYYLFRSRWVNFSPCVRVPGEEGFIVGIAVYVRRFSRRWPWSKALVVRIDYGRYGVSVQIPGMGSPSNVVDWMKDSFFTSFP